MLGSTATHDLPVRFDSMIGRREEVSLVRRLLQTSARVVTLTGAPGVGKSSVAVAVAESMQRSVSGVWYVDLRNRDTAVATLVAHELKVDPGDDAVDAVVAAIADADVLLLLDNADAAVPEVSAFVDALLGSCAGARLVVTSREPLVSPAQALVALGPFAHTGLSASSDAVRLFGERAVSGDAFFAVDDTTLTEVLRVCEATRGVPLAIELAAAQLQFMDIQTLAGRIGEQLETLEPAEPTARSLRAAVVDSWERSLPAERQVWSDLSVLAPGWDLELGEAVAGRRASGQREATQVIKQLIRRSVIHRRRTDDGVRYELLPAIQEFGAAHAENLDEARLHFIVCMLVRLHDAEDNWFSGRQRDILRRLRADIPNIRNAVLTAAALGRADTAIEAVTTLWRQAWWIHGSGDELASWLDLSLQAGPVSPYWASLGHSLRSWVYGAMHKPLLAQAELSLAAAAYDEVAAGGDVAAEHECRIGLRSAQEVEEPDDTAAVDALTALMDELGEEAYLFGRLNPPQRLAARLHSLGRWEEGRRIDDEIARRGLAVGDRFERSFALTTRATAEAAAGDYAGTEADAREALLLKRGLGDRIGVALALELLADVAREKADAARGATLLGCAAGRWREAGAIRINYPPYFYDRQSTERALRLRLGDAVFDRAFGYGLELGEDEAIHYALHSIVEARLRSGTPQPTAASGLTPRETQVASLVAEGETNKAIAGRLFVSIRTVESHVQNALVKLGLRSRTELAVWYREQANAR
ncbi:helix-turn-helix transcriptional regulator [Leifsonia sp. 2MCAF36]|uniref:helix-turn-helix transcriptional regulator n=1 Tax=Leifsonia sp. 2MCAF36 TaxID=3232988 RepID=UPI003F9A61BC